MHLGGRAFPCILLSTTRGENCTRNYPRPKGMSASARARGKTRFCECKMADGVEQWQDGRGACSGEDYVMLWNGWMQHSRTSQGPRLRALAALLAGLLLAGPVSRAAADGKIIRAGIGTDRPDLAQALRDCQPGDTLLVAAGAYHEMLTIKKNGKSAEQRITIKAEQPRRAVFSRKGQAALIEGSFLRIEGFVFDSQYGNASCVRASGQHIQVIDCEIRRAGTVDAKPWGDGLQFFDAAHCLVEKCHIHHCLASRDGQRDDAHGIRLTHAHDMTIRGCRIDIISGDCLQVDPNRQDWDRILIEDCTLSGGKIGKDDPYAHPRFAVGSYTSENAIDIKCPKKGRPRITIRNCDVHGFRGPIGNAAAFNIKENCQAVIDRCTIHDSVIGLRLRAPAWVTVTNCVLHGNDTHCRYEDGVPRLHLYHCTFGAVTGQGAGFFQEQRPSPDLRVLGCLFLGDKPRQAAAASNQGAGAALFRDAARHDYRLQAAAPLGAQARPPADAALGVDRTGSARGAAPDAGAYQFQPVPPNGR